MKLKEIADMFGFYDEFHYSKAFKKLFNTSPNAFRTKAINLSCKKTKSFLSYKIKL